MSIDLSLAMNYLPACACLGKSMVLIAALFIVHKYTLPPLYVGVGVCLILDRMHFPSRIFDANALLCGVFVGECVSVIRAAASETYTGLVATHAVGFVWVCCSVFILVFSQGKQQHFSSRDLQVGSCLTSAAVSLCAFLPPDDNDTREARIARSAAFVLLGVAWVYVIGVNMPRLVHGRDTTLSLTVIFTPLLYVNGYLALVHTAVAAVFLAWRLVGKLHIEAVERAWGAEMSPQCVTVEEPPEDLQEMFRQAKAATGTGD